MKIGYLILLASLLCACASDPMRSPLSATTEIELQASLLTLEKKVSSEQFEQTRKAIGILMVTNIDLTERQRFLQEVIDGQSPNQLISASKPGAARYRIK